MSMTPHRPEILEADKLSKKELLTAVWNADITRLQIFYGNISKNLNFGVLIYKIFELAGKKSTPFVDLETECARRALAVKNWLINMLSPVGIGRDLRPSTIATEFYRVRNYLLWNISAGAYDVLDSPEQFHHRLKLYSFECQAIVASGGSPNYQKAILDHVKNAGSIMLDENYNFDAGLAILLHSPDDISHTDVPSDSTVAHSIKTVSDLFIGIHDFILNHRSFPHSFNVNGKKVWLVSNSVNVIISESQMIDRVSFGLGNDRLRRIMDQARMDSENQKSPLSECIARAMHSTQLIEINLEHESRKRYKLSRFAHDCFLFEFLLVTSANSSPAGQIEWLPNSEVLPYGQGFRCIKFRADKNIIISFGANFTEEFRRYLELRSVLTDKRQHNLLFGNFKKNGKHQALVPSALSSLENRVINLIDPSFSRLGSRKLRAYGENYTQRNSNLEAAAERSQHSISTALKSYTSGNIVINNKELTVFFTAVGDRLNQGSTVVETAASECTGELIDAVQINEHTGVKPDCKNFLGCLFCTHFLVHGNEQDLRKLFSIIYIIEQYKSAQFNGEEFLISLAPTLLRAKQIIETMKAHSPQLSTLAEEIEKEVFEEEELTPYWMRKLNLLIEVGVL